LLLNQLKQLENPDGRVVLTEEAEHGTLGDLADCWQGICTGDYPRFGRVYWEVPRVNQPWIFQMGTVESHINFHGREQILNWGNGRGELHAFLVERLGEGGLGAWIRGLESWGKDGIAISQMRELFVTRYSGAAYDNNVAALVPKHVSALPAIWCFLTSGQYAKAVRAIDQSLKVTNKTLLKVPFDFLHWQKVAEERYPDGLPEPHSDDLTQWLFRGDIPSSTDPLQVAVARLLGYAWPDQLDDCLSHLLDSDGIVTLTPLVHQEGLANRLRALLQAAYESQVPTRPKGAPLVEEPRVWDETTLPRLLARAGSPGMSLEDWLRDKFFESHCKLFHQRPFLWHIWDGRKDGFQAIVNYHKLDSRNLDRLTHVYLGEWIERQRHASDAGDTTADARLIAAQELQRKLELIRTGEPPYDIFVRWKTKAEQPIGWDPDLNDGVRMNIRPFIEAGILRGRVNVNWNKDRGKDPKPNASGTVERHNDRHFTLAEKRAAREEMR
jgi:hypothetical protein